MKLGIFIGCFCLFLSCSDDKIDIPTDGGPVRLSMTVSGFSDFETYIRSLIVYAFRQEESGEYFYYKVLADLDAAGIRQLESASSGGGNGEVKWLNTELPPGNYRLFLAGNVRPQGEPEVGVSKPEDLRLIYPREGLFWSYFLGQGDVKAEGTAVSVSIELKRAVSRLFVKLSGIPWQIDRITLSLRGVAGEIGLDGTLFSASVVEETFQMKNEDVYLQDTVLFDVFSFPSVGKSSALNFIFYSKSGEERIKTVEISLLPDKYLYLTGEVNEEEGGLLTYSISFIFLLVLDWVDIQLPDFSLKPVEK